jgi:hypothetical protein
VKKGYFREGDKSESFKKFICLEDPNDLIPGLEIGHEAHSQTTRFKAFFIPGKMNIKVGDTPGYLT